MVQEFWTVGIVVNGITKHKSVHWFFFFSFESMVESCQSLFYVYSFFMYKFFRVHCDLLSCYVFISVMHYLVCHIIFKPFGLVKNSNWACRQKIILNNSTQFFKLFSYRSLLYSSRCQYVNDFHTNLLSIYCTEMHLCKSRDS